MNKNALAYLGLSLLAAGCGSNSGDAVVTLLTGLENPTQFKNLMRGISEPQALVSGGQSCIQRGLFAGMKIGTTKDVLTYPVGMKTPLIDNTTSIDALWISQNSSFSAIKIPAPKGSAIGFGLIGSIVQPGAVNPDGTCAEFDPTADEIPFPSYSLIGHRDVVITGDMTLPLNVWVLKATDRPAMPTNLSLCDDKDHQDVSQTCAPRNYTIMKCVSNCPATSLLKAEYFKGANRNEQVVQWFKYADYMNGVAIPDIEGTRFSIVSGGQELGSRIFQSDQLNGGNTTTFPIVLPDGTNALFQVERYGGSSFNLAFTQIDAGPVTYPTWNTYPGAAYYRIYGAATPDGAQTGGIIYKEIQSAPGAFQTANVDLNPNILTYITVEPLDASLHPIGPRSSPPEAVIPINLASVTANVLSAPAHGLQVSFTPAGSPAVESVTISLVRQGITPADTYFTSCGQAVNGTPASPCIAYSSYSGNHFWSLVATNSHHGKFILPLTTTATSLY